MRRDSHGLPAAVRRVATRQLGKVLCSSLESIDAAADPRTQEGDGARKTPASAAAGTGSPSCSQKK
jgi:hypothetical protein